MITIKQIHKEYRKEGGDISWPTFKRILEEFNVGLSDLIVEKGHRFKVSGIGTFRIARRKRRGTSRVDYNATRLKKKEILARGGTPYEVTERDENGKILGDNGGERYLVTFTGEDYYFCWTVGHEGLIRNNGHTYKFIPTRGKKGNKEKLSNFLRENPLAELMYI